MIPCTLYMPYIPLIARHIVSPGTGVRYDTLYLPYIPSGASCVVIPGTSVRYDTSQSPLKY